MVNLPDIGDLKPNLPISERTPVKAMLWDQKARSSLTYISEIAMIIFPILY
jgi:hypothetical protein